MSQKIEKELYTRRWHRTYPLTNGISKQHPVMTNYDLLPLSVMMLANIKDILVISTLRYAVDKKYDG